MFFLILEQDKNRDVIVAFPDVAPNSISTLSKLLTKTHKQYGAHPSMRSILEDASDSYDQPHLWYSNSEVIPALKLFISSGDELSNSDTYRLAYFWSKSPTIYKTKTKTPGFK